MFKMPNGHGKHYRRVTLKCYASRKSNIIKCLLFFGNLKFRGSSCLLFKFNLMEIGLKMTSILLFSGLYIKKITTNCGRKGQIEVGSIFLPT